MLITAIILFIIGLLFCFLFAAKVLDEQNKVAEDIAIIKQNMETFMATAAELQAVAQTLLETANQVKTIVEGLKANSVNPADLDPVAATLGQSVSVLQSIVNS